MTTIHPFQSPACQNYLLNVMKQIASVKVASLYRNHHRHRTARADKIRLRRQYTPIFGQRDEIREEQVHEQSHESLSDQKPVFHFQQYARHTTILRPIPVFPSNGGSILYQDSELDELLNDPALSAYTLPIVGCKDSHISETDWNSDFSSLSSRIPIFLLNLYC